MWDYINMDTKCTIPQHPDFDTVCLIGVIFEIAHIMYLRYKKPEEEPQSTNKQTK
jgi:hypothetical protein